MPIAAHRTATGGAAVDDDSNLGVGDAIVRVADDAKAYAAAQIALYKTMANARFRAARLAIILIAAAAALATSALTGLVIGSIFALVPQLGAFTATLVVVGIVSVVAALLGWLAARRLARAFGEIE